MRPLEAEVDEGGTAEIEANVRPETWARGTDRALLGGPVISEMLREYTLRGKTHLSLLLPGCHRSRQSSFQPQR